MAPSDLDVLVLGSGVAGLSAAVRAATADLRVGVLTKDDLHQSATRWAQGGVAAVLGGDPDSTDLHLADTLRAGAGLCDEDAVRVLVDEGPPRVEELVTLGAVFDRDPDGTLQLAREGGHSRPRVVHAGGAATGAEIERALVEAVQSTAAALMERWFALDLLVEHGRCAGVVAVDESGARRHVRARHTLLATGGSGQLYAVTTNPLQATGDGVAMALRASVPVADVEFVQFHPTALHHPQMPRPLLSEALRGHGALLRDARGERFVDELLPRDVVARAMTERLLDQGVEHLWLDATGLDRFDQRFPTISAAVRGVGLDPSADWLPIAPAAHYAIGGVVTDLDGASGLDRLWAAGEVACTGVHGANRLASNSLLEGMVFAARVVDAIVAGKESPQPTGAMRSVLAAAGAATWGDDVIGGRSVAIDHLLPGAIDAGAVDAGAVDAGAVDAGAVDAGAVDAAKARECLQRAMTAGAGVLRSEASLRDAARAVDSVVGSRGGNAELRNLLTLARATIAAAIERCESRGAHNRTDHPGSRPEMRERFVLR